MKTYISKNKKIVLSDELDGHNGYGLPFYKVYKNGKELKPVMSIHQFHLKYIWL